jgi:hypothetical protein
MSVVNKLDKPENLEKFLDDNKKYFEPIESHFVLSKFIAFIIFSKAI